MTSGPEKVVWALALLATISAEAAGVDGGKDADGYKVVRIEHRGDGVTFYLVRSPFQKGETLIRVALPRPAPAVGLRRVLFILPVEPREGTRWGDGFQAAMRLKVRERLRLALVAPSFSDWPWYADHPRRPELRQESYFLRAVVPLVQTIYPHEPEGRLLVGFSKSGWGAWSLLLRHPEQFAAACAWDAPLMMARPAFGMAAICGTQQNFANYQVAPLLRKKASILRKGRRLVLLGYGNFRNDTVGAHRLLERLGVPHVYADGPHRAHRWDGGWLKEAIEALDELSAPGGHP